MGEAVAKTKTIAYIYERNQQQPVVDKLLDRSVVGLETINSDQIVGIEVELENYVQTIHLPSATWNVHNDGSLRNHGVEWVTQPIPARDAPFALHELFHGRADGCCFSPRTSVHVHMNCLDLSRDQVLDVVLLYLHLERPLYNFVGRQRIKNMYCVPLNETNLTSNLLTQNFETKVHSWKKYTGLNLLPLESLGTIEFRQMHGTPEIRKLCIWIRMLTKLFQYCKEVGTSKLRETLVKCTTWDQQQQLIADVFGADAIHLRGGNTETFDLITAKQAWIKGVKPSSLGLDSYTESPFALFKASKGAK